MSPYMTWVWMGLKGMRKQHHSRKTQYQPGHSFYGVMLRAYLSLGVVVGAHVSMRRPANRLR